jgi:hypothetical protein
MPAAAAAAAAVRQQNAAAPSSDLTVMEAAAMTDCHILLRITLVEQPTLAIHILNFEFRFRLLWRVAQKTRIFWHILRVRFSSLIFQGDNSVRSRGFGFYSHL